MILHLVHRVFNVALFIIHTGVIFTGVISYFSYSYRPVGMILILGVGAAGEASETILRPRPLDR